MVNETMVGVLNEGFGVFLKGDDEILKDLIFNQDKIRTAKNVH